MTDLVDPNLLAPAAEVQQISRIPTAVAAEAPWITERRAEAATLAEDCHGTAATAPWTARTPAPAWSGSCLSGPPSLSTTTSTIMGMINKGGVTQIFLNQRRKVNPLLHPEEVNLMKDLSSNKVRIFNKIMRNMT